MDQLQLPGIWQTLLSVFRAIFIFLDAVLLGIFLYSLKQVWAFRPKFRAERKAKKKTVTLRTALVLEGWRKVREKASVGSPESLRLAVIEADTIVDGVLKEIGISGEHMADRLAKVNPDTLKSLERVWRAHRLRNDLAHTPGFSLSAEDAREAIEDYEAFLKEIGVLK